MSCLNICCPPHNFVATTDPAATDCEDSVVPGYETSGGYCPGSKWYNTIDDTWWIGVNDMACNTAQWKRITPVLEPLAHVKAQLGVYQSIPTMVSTKLDFLNEIYDYNNDWSTITNEFTAPRDGFYLVQCSLRPSISPGVSTSGWKLGDNLHVVGYVNGVFSDDWLSGSQTFMHDTGTSQVFQRVITSHSVTVRLTAGDTFYLVAAHEADAAITLHPTNSFIQIDELPSMGLF